MNPFIRRSMAAGWILAAGAATPAQPQADPPAAPPRQGVAPPPPPGASTTPAPVQFGSPPADTPLPPATPLPPGIKPADEMLPNPGATYGSEPGTAPGVELPWRGVETGTSVPGPEARADEPPNQDWFLFSQDNWLKVRGWVDGGSTYNINHPPSRFNGPYNAVDQDNSAFNQGYLILEHSLDPCKFSIGGRVDLLYGNDFFLPQSRGLELNPDGTRKWNSSQYYGVAMPQAYVEAGWEKLSAKFGHFYSILGYEDVPSADNFFYSHAYSYQFSQPFTHWGGLGTWKPSDTIEVQAGVVNGWNTLDGTEDHVNGLVGVKYTACDKSFWTSAAVITGDEFDNPAGLRGVRNGYNNRTEYSFIFDGQLTEKLEYVFHHYLGLQEHGARNGETAYWYGIDQYLYYKLTDTTRTGMRFEWFRDEDGTRVVSVSL
jgi:hypothetical protein